MLYRSVLKMFFNKKYFLNKKNLKKHFCLLWDSNKQPQNLNFHGCGGLDSAEGFDRWLLMSETILMEWEKDMGGRSKVHDSSYIFASSVLPRLDKVQPFFFLEIISYYNVLVWCSHFCFLKVFFFKYINLFLIYLK